MESVRDGQSPSGYYLKPLALAVSVYLIAVDLWTWVYSLPLFLAGKADLRPLYMAGYMLRTGHARQLYDVSAQQFFQTTYVGPGDFPLPYNHLAYEALLYGPFSIFRYRTAYVAFIVFNLGLLTVIYRLLSPRLRNIASIYWWLPLALLGGFIPIGITLMQGQDSIVLLLLLVGAWAALGKGRELAAGALVALGLFKFTIMLPIGFLFFVWRRWRFVAGFTATSAGLISTSLALVGTTQTIKYIHMLRNMSVALSTPADQAAYGISISSMPDIRGLVFGLASAYVSNEWIQWATFIVSGLLLFQAAVAGRKMIAPDSLLFAITVSALVGYHLLLHDMSVLLLPIVVAFDRYLDDGREQKRSLGKAAAALFVAPLIRAFASYHFYLACLPLCAFGYFQARQKLQRPEFTAATQSDQL